MFDSFLSVILSVIASVISYYICKWLDRYLKLTASTNKKPGAATPGFLFCVHHMFMIAPIRL